MHLSPLPPSIVTLLLIGRHECVVDGFARIVGGFSLVLRWSVAQTEAFSKSARLVRESCVVWICPAKGSPYRLVPCLALDRLNGFHGRRAALWRPLTYWHMFG